MRYFIDNLTHSYLMREGNSKYILGGIHEVKSQIIITIYCELSGDLMSNPSEGQSNDSVEITLPIFPINYDDQMIEMNFDPQIPAKKQNHNNQNFRFPDESLIVDMMLHPSILTSFSTRFEVWRQVLSPIFLNHPQDSWNAQQMLILFFGFLKERGASIYQQETENKHRIDEQYINDLETINKIHYQNDEPDEEMQNNISEIKNAEDASKFVNSFKKIEIQKDAISNYYKYEKITKFLLEKMNSEPTEETILNVFKWGIIISDVSTVFESYIQMEKMQENFNFSQKYYTKQILKDLVSNFSLYNSIFSPFCTDIKEDVQIPKIQPQRTKTSIIASDGNFLYCLFQKQLYIKPLSRTTQINYKINKSQIKNGIIKNFESQIEFIAIFCLSKYLFLVSDKNMEAHDGSIYLLDKENVLNSQNIQITKDNLHKVPIKSSNSKYFPLLTSQNVVSDGSYLYSFDPLSSRVHIFKFDSIFLVMIHSIELSHFSCMSNDNLIMYINGCIFTVIENLARGNMNTYKFSSFSLIDGSLIKQYNFSQKYQLISVYYDFYQNLFWIIHQKGTFYISKMKNFGSQSCLFTGVDLQNIYSLSKVLESEATDFDTLSYQIISFLDYYSAHFVGCSFMSSITRRNHYSGDSSSFYDPKTACFFAPCRQDTVLSLFHSLMYYLEKDDLRYHQKQLCILLRLLTYNITNFNDRNINEFHYFLDEDLLCQILMKLREILNDKKYKFLHCSISFFFIDSFSNIFKGKCCTECAPCFNLIWNTMCSDYIFGAIRRIYSCHEYPYSISSSRSILEPIIKYLTLPNKKLSKPQTEFIDTFFSNLMFEMRSIYQKFPTEFPTQAKLIQNSFFTFSYLLTSEILNYLDQLDENTITQIENSHLIYLFRKWMMLLVPLTKYSRLCSVLSFLNPLYFKIKEKVNLFGNKYPTNKSASMTFLDSIYYEVFFLNIEFLFAQMNGGSEVKNISQFEWLIDQTKDSKLTLNHVYTIYEAMLSGNAQTSPMKRKLKKGFSYNAIGYDKNDISSNTVEKLISTLIQNNESESIKSLFDYLYTKVNSVMAKRKISEEDRHIERLFIVALMKQLGLSNEFCLLNFQILKGDKPVLSHYIKRIVDCTFLLRRIFAQARQKEAISTTTSIQSQTASSLSTTNSRSLSFSELKKAIIMKCLFLLHLEPCVKCNVNEFEKYFGELLNKIRTFITSNITLEEYFNLLDTSENAQRHAQNSLSSFTKILQIEKFSPLGDYLIQSIASTGIVSKFIETVEGYDIFKSSEAYMDLIVLLNILNDKIYKATNKAAVVSFTILFLSISLSISKYSDDMIYVPMKRLIPNILEKKKNFFEDEFFSLIAFIVSHFSLYHNEIPKDFIKEIEFELFSENSVICAHIPIAHLACISNFGLIYEKNILIQALSDCPPSAFHQVCSLISDMKIETNDKILLLHTIMSEIANITSGESKLFLIEKPSVTTTEVLPNSVCKTSSAILCGCCELIYICRRFLNENDEDMINIISFILDTNNPNTQSCAQNDFKGDYRINDSTNGETKSQLMIFKDKRFLFAVFAILSNSINEINKYSLIKDSESDKIYYIENIDYKNMNYMAWQVPISDKSVLKEIPFSQNLKPISLIPFSISQFTNTDLLIPYFVYYLEHPKNTVFDESLTFYIISSLKEYSLDPEFLTKFLKSFATLKVHSLSFTDSDTSFKSILHKHLSILKSGFYFKKSPIPIFYCASPCDNLVDTQYQITKEFLISKCSSVLFMTDILIKNNYYFTVDLENALYCDIGILKLNYDGWTKDSLLISLRDKKKCLINSQNPTSISNKLLFVFDGKSFEASVFDVTTQKLVHSRTFPDYQIVFAVVLYGNEFIKYELSNECPTWLTQSHESSIQFIQSLVPLSGSIVFHRKLPKAFMRQTKKTQNIDYLNNHIKEKINNKMFEMEKIKNDNHIMVQIYKNEEGNKKKSLITYSSDMLSFTNKDFNISFLPRIDAFTTNKVLFSESYRSDSFPLMNHICYYEISHSWHLLFHKIYNQQDTLIIDDNLLIDKYPQTIQMLQKTRMPNISLDNYGILPPGILNYFVSCNSHFLRRDTVYQLLLYCLSTTNMSIESILKFFCIKENKLLKYYLNLLLMIEPITVELMNKSIPFKLDVSVVDKFISSNRHLEAASINKINKYIRSPDKIDQFIQLWADSINHSFRDPNSFSIVDCHPTAIYIPPQKFKVVEQQGIDGFIIIQDGSFIQYDSNKIIAQITYGNDQTITLDSVPIVIEANSCKVVTLSCGVAVIPYSNNDHSYLFDTFIHFFVSLKYFIKFIGENSNRDYYMIQKVRIQLYIDFIDAMIYQTPFLRLHGKEYLLFLNKTLPVFPLDYEQGLLQRMNLLYQYNGGDPAYSYIKPFLEEHQITWSEKPFLYLKIIFPEFSSESEINHIQHSVQDKELKIPLSPFPRKISKKDNPMIYINIIKRLLLPREKLNGYPIHFLIFDWIKYINSFPPIDSKTIEGNILQIKFTCFTPNKISINLSISEIHNNKINNNTMNNNFDNNMNHSINHNMNHNMKKNMNENPNQNTLKLLLSYSPDFDSSIPIQSNTMFSVDPTHNIIFVKIADNEIIWDTLKFYIEAEKPKDFEDNLNQYGKKFLKLHRDRFVSDIKVIATMCDSVIDQTILSCVTKAVFSKLKLKLELNPQVLTHKRLNHHLHILILRARLILILNWAIFNQLINYKDDPSFKKLLSSVSNTLKLDSLRKAIDSKSGSRSAHLHVDRKIAGEVRAGNIKDFNKTVIAQVANQYNNVSSFRVKSDKPWNVSFAHERGVDAGGPARELVSVLASDLCALECGLVVPVPNARNKIGGNRECVIPVPSPLISFQDAQNRYRFAGALIAICIRTGLVQYFNFPHLVWEYLLSQELEISSIFEIDQSYKLQIESLQDAMNNENENSQAFNQRFVVLNSFGDEVPLTQNGKNEIVTIHNVGKYISMANEFRIKEMKPFLEAMRNGLWENLNIEPLPNLDWTTLEFAACGESEISVEALKQVTSFNGISSDQQTIFWRVVESFTSEQRSDLLKFSTGRTRLPPNNRNNKSFLRLDSLNSRDAMPSSSTCFHQLHYPFYSSFEKARKLISLAIEFTDTFELS
ncbi:hypothetical protein TRFO_12199 [Tritrichomonas foetus]|uniref:HECT domain-containing protein n=1 Tax=Tritrichomonas foetus TaxID=1144522 RepID=A0A1J4J3V8_9EUKA|nr:hypothetical protein TRFO_12199 [Tritrichomonas foetus]|eukprot:OHS92847.1 hypothetical protein TRFO_12199 [Tritrichomonas foetus]